MSIANVMAATVCVALVADAIPAQSQVRLSSAVVALSDHERFADFQVQNSSLVPQEVQIDLRFAYPVPDGVGGAVLEYGDAERANRYSMDSWARVFPRQFVLQPGAVQVVRLIVSPPPEIPNGAYWTRIITTSTPQAAPLDSVTSGIAPNIILRVEQVTTLLYRRGSPASAVLMDTPALRESGDTLTLDIPLRRTGEAPFFGTVYVQARDGGTVVAEQRMPVGVYFDAAPRFRLHVRACRATDCDVEVRVESGRVDVPADLSPPMSPVVVRVRR